MKKKQCFFSVVETGAAVNRIRPARFIGANSFVAAYQLRSAEGNEILQNVDKGQFASTDYYGIHATTKDPKCVLVATDR